MLWLYVFWNGFYTRKSQFSCNFWNPQFLLLLLLPSWWSFARGRPLILTTTKRAWKMHFWDPLQCDKMCFESHCIKFQVKEGSKFLHLLLVRAEGPDPLHPLMVILTVKCMLFFYDFPKESLQNICEVCIQQLDLFLPMTWSNWTKRNEKSTLSNGGEGCMVLLFHSSSLDG